MSDYKIIDGGLSSELAYQGFSCDGDSLWTGRWIIQDSEALKTAHINFLENGSDVIESATYQLSIQSLCDELGIGIENAKEHIRSGVTIAIEARDKFVSKYNHEDQNSKGNAINKKQPLVAGSVGPYGAALCDLSEYTGSYVSSMSIEELMDWHRPRLSCLVEANADIIAFETIPAAKEGQALVHLLREFPNTKAWLSFTCKDGDHTCYGDNFRATVKTCLQQAPADQIVAIGANCVAPDIVDKLISSCAKDVKPINIIVYPNSGEKYTQDGWIPDKKVHPIEAYVPTWISSGATWIGGCCRTTSETICKIRETVASTLNKIQSR